MASDLNKYVIFKLIDEYYGLDIENVISVEKMQEFTRVPNAPSYVRGVINLRGEVIPVIDLREKLGLKLKSTDENTRIIIVSESEINLGIVVDSSSEVLEIQRSLIDKPLASEEESNNYLKGIGKVDGRLIIIIDLEKLIEA
ncbi:chemotaxis protein CheW [Acidilutibacter cellobiosedens]|jgi:purine-binding chemotaxis protein CheW|uniref:Chemotaxis protein CheW n=1 Tax=Acidilutibacter cellobiosedens TaxID=2507161 RepID=A0A410QCC6_9FIRM|nr:chemotaxis protein CheW [Acidilutibacter cellobiosedens]MBE6081735.1 chemotaxis protein CheW [Tissierellaceae bacterium]QAT61630.1 chemotaxis protein CheW [Acidilutibacter cellobiosedens]